MNAGERAAEDKRVADEQLRTLQSQARVRGLQALEESTRGLGRLPAVRKVLSNPDIMTELLVNGGMDKPEDFVKYFESLTPDPFKQENVAPGATVMGPDLEGKPQVLFRAPTTNMQDDVANQKQAGARAEALGMLSEYLGKGFSRQQVYEKAIANKALMKKWQVDGQGKLDDLNDIINGGTPKPLEQQNRSPGSETLIPNQEGTGFTSVGKTPTAEEQNYVNIETRFGPDVAQEIFRIAGPNMNPTEKQQALLNLVKANPGNKELEQTAFKVQSGLIQSSSYFDPIQQKIINTFVDLTKPGSQTAGANTAPVVTGTTAQPSAVAPPDPTKGGAFPVPMQQQPGQPGAQAQGQPNYLPQFTPPAPLPADMTMTAGDAAFELGPPGAVSEVLNTVFAPLGFAKTNDKRQDAVAAFNTLADVSREYFQNSGRPLAADVKLAIDRMPKANGTTMGFFETPTKALSKIAAIRGQIEKDMTYYAGILSRPTEYNAKVISDAQEAFTRGENALKYFPTKEEMTSYKAKAKDLEEKGPKGVGNEIMKRWKDSVQGVQVIEDYLGGDTGKPESLEEKKQRLIRERNKLIEQQKGATAPTEPTQPEEDDNGEPLINVGPEQLDKIFNPAKKSKEELIKKREELLQMKQQQQGMRVPLGDGTFAEPASEQLVEGRDGEMVTLDEAIQQNNEDLAGVQDQEAGKLRRLHAEIRAIEVHEQTGIPIELIHGAFGVQSGIANMLTLPTSAVRNALIAVGAARIMNPEWQGDRSTESLVKEWLTKNGSVVDYPEGSLAGKFGEGAIEGAALLLGFTALGPRLAVTRGPQVIRAVTGKISKLLSNNSKLDALWEGALSGGVAADAGQVAKDMGAGPKTQAAAEITAGALSPGKGTINLVKRVVKDVPSRFSMPKPKPKLRPEGPGAQMTQLFGEQMANASKNKAAHAKTVLAKFTKKDPDIAIADIFKAKNPEVAMRAIMASTRKDKDAYEGLRRGTMDYLFKKSGLFTPQFTPDKFAKVWNDPTARRAFAAIFGKDMVKRIDDAIGAEARLSTGQQPGKLKPLLKAGAAGALIDITAGSGGLATALFVGRVMGAEAMKATGRKTLQATSAGADIGKSAARRLYNKLFPGSIDAATLFREALLDPNYERLLISRADKLAKRTARSEAKTERRRRGLLVGTSQAFDEDNGEED